ncbi:hypothetical protein BM48_0876 [Streptococcus pneumoniae]|nr:hypothetical protein BM48_0876 [Streptococcus pneumoniae]
MFANFFWFIENELVPVTAFRYDRSYFVEEKILSFYSQDFLSSHCCGC